MSLKGVLEFAIQLEGFRNIDLFHQGLYQVRINIYHQQNGHKILAHPYHTKEKDPKDSKKKSSKPIISPHIIDETCSYVSRTFVIRFCDEETDFNEVCHFRTEYDVFPDLSETTFYIEAELMFADLSKLTQPKNGHDDTLAAFKSISFFKAKINNIHLGVHEYLPILFDDMHFCVLHSMFHAVLMDLRFRTSPIEAPREETFATEQDKKPEQLLPPPKNFPEFLARNTGNFKTGELEKFYNYYIKSLNRSYQKLVNFYTYVLKVSLMDKMPDDFKKYASDAPFKELMADYLFNDKKLRKLLLLYSEHKDEITLPEKPTNLFENIPDKKITDLIKPEDPSSVATEIMKEINVIAGNTFQSWYLLVDMMMDCPKMIISLLRDDYLRQLKERWGESIFQQIYRIPELSITYEPKLGETHKQIAAARRGNLYYKVLDIYNSIEDINMFPKPEFHPILFEEVYIKDVLGKDKTVDAMMSEIENNYKKGEYKGIHLIVMSHGFQGNSYDLRLFKNNISYLYPDTMFLCASCNEDMTDGEIAQMGVRLANEVKTYIDEWIPGNNLGRLSFIGHSMGGLIIRCALQYLEQYQSKFHLFMTLSSPHLGYMYHSSKIVDAGMWVLKKWRKSRGLQELTMTDAEKMEDTYLYKLSKAKGLAGFKIVTFLSSYQDQYAPFESARIQVSKKSESSKGTIYQQMAKNILSHVTTDHVYRIDINFKIEEKNLDSMIGRAAHIKFLESQALMRMLIFRFGNFFS